MWFLSSCLHSAVNLTRVREWRFNYKNSLSLLLYVRVCVCRGGGGGGVAQWLERRTREGRV